MTTPEDRLRQILLAEAEDLIPAGDGLRRIEQRLAARRTLRSRLVPAVAVAGMAVVAGVAAVTVSLTNDGSLDQPPSTRTSPDPTTCAGSLCQEPKPSPSLSTTGVTTSASGTPVWPFTSDAQAAEWEASPGTRTWARDPVAVVQHLLDDYVQLPGHAETAAADFEDELVVDVTAAGRTVSQVRLVQVGRADDGPWSVVSATSSRITVTQPKDGAEVSSPISITGTATDPDTSVHLRLMADTMRGEGFAMAGREIPWNHSLPWTGTDWTVGALVAHTSDGKGDLSAITITAVRRSAAITPGLPAAGSVFVALDQEHVVSVDASTGKQVRQVSYPPAGTTDSNPDLGGGDVVWVRTQTDACSSSVIRAGLARGTATTTVDAKRISRSLPALSERGRSLAWVERPCGGGNGEATVIVRGPDANLMTTARSTEPFNDLDVRDDGYAVVRTGNRVVILPPGTTSVQAGRAVVPTQGCMLDAPAWNGDDLFAWQSCNTGWVLGRWSSTGVALEPASGVVDGMSAALHMSATEGQLLVSLANYRIVRLSGNDLVDIPNALRWKQADW